MMRSKPPVEEDFVAGELPEVDDLDEESFAGTRDFSAQELLRAEREDEERREIEKGLPHLFAYKWYPWAREFFESKNRFNLLCAGNQASKSSTQIRKCIEWATNPELWPELWPDTIKAGAKPNQFWYLYPSQKVVDAEWLTKWSQFMPKGRFKNDPQYGWKVLRENSKVVGVQFFSGVYLFFKTYSQKVIDIQTGSVFAMFCDEELPVHHYDELMFRLTATKGYFHMVFTATLGQDFWRQAMEPMAHEDETLVSAWKKQVSLYDCMEYEDGTQSQWTADEIENVKSKCRTHDEYQRRVWGRFITPVEGRKYPSFDSTRHYVEPHKIPGDWDIFEGVDIGSGGEGHPAAISFIAVAPNRKQARLFLGWRGDGIGNTTAGDVFEKHLELRHVHQLKPTRKFYDQGCRDFKTISDRYSAVNDTDDQFEPAEKDHTIGDDIVDLLFKHDVCKVFNTPELQKFGIEITTVKKGTPKNKRKDDFVDAFRYGVTSIDWGFEAFHEPYIEPVPVIKEESADERASRERKERAAAFRGRAGSGYSAEAEAEFAELNELYGCG